MNKSDDYMGNTLSQEMIDKYLAGKLSNEEAHRVEKIMLESDFDQEAMDGFEEAYPSGEIEQDLTFLSQQIDQKVASEKKKTPFWLKIAASVVILIASTILVLNIDLKPENEKQVASETAAPKEEEVFDQKKSDAPSSIQGDSDLLSDSLLALNDVQSKEANQDQPKRPNAGPESPLITETTPAEVSGLVAMEEVVLEDEDIVDELADDEISEPNPEFEIAASGAANNISSNQANTLPTKSISGVVKTNNGEKLVGVSIRAKGTGLGAVTDINGEFTLEVPNTHDTIVASFIGLVSQKIDIKSVENVEILMEEDENSLSEVVIAQNRQSQFLDEDSERKSAEASRIILSEKALKKEQTNSNKKAKRKRRRTVFAGTRSISGNVLSSEDSTVIPGVNILVEGTTTYAKTDDEGKFSVEIPDDPETTLAFAFVGLENKEVAVGDQNNIELYLTPDTTKQSDIVVVDYEANLDAINNLLSTRAYPKGGNKELSDYIESNMLNSSEENIGGVVIEFTVLANGKLTDFNVVKGLDSVHNKEAERLIREGPGWTPATIDGRPQRDKVRVRIKFDK